MQAGDARKSKCYAIPQDHIDFSSICKVYISLLLCMEVEGMVVELYYKATKPVTTVQDCVSTNPSSYENDWIGQMQAIPTTMLQHMRGKRTKPLLYRCILIKRLQNYLVGLPKVHA